MSKNHSLTRIIILLLFLSGLLSPATAFALEIDAGGNTPIHEAAAHGRIELLPALLARSDLDINTQNKFGQTALMMAIAEKQFAAARLLAADPRLNPNLQENQKVSALQLAIFVGGANDVARSLIQNPKTNLKLVDARGRAPLFFAVAMGNTDALTWLLADPRSDVNQTDEQGQTPLMMAAQRLDKSPGALLLANPAVLVLAVDNAGRTALHYAARDLSMFPELLDRAVVASTVRDKEGHTPIEFQPDAIMRFALEGITEQHASARRPRGKDPAAARQAMLNRDFLESARDGDLIRSRQALVRGAQLNAADRNGNTALALAVSANQLEMTQVLLRYRDLLVNLQTPRGNTALHLALLARNRELALLILRRPDAAALLRNSAGATALELAHNLGDPEVTRMAEAAH